MSKKQTKEQIQRQRADEERILSEERASDPNFTKGSTRVADKARKERYKREDDEEAVLEIFKSVAVATMDIFEPAVIDFVVKDGFNVLFRIVLPLPLFVSVIRVDGELFVKVISVAVELLLKPVPVIIPFVVKVGFVVSFRIVAPLPLFVNVILPLVVESTYNFVANISGGLSAVIGDDTLTFTKFTLSNVFKLWSNI